MGGGSAQKPKKTAAPPQAQPIDYAKLMADSRAQAGRDNQAVFQQSNAASQESYSNQLNALIQAYPELEALQLGTISKISNNLSAKNNAYTKRATNQLIAAEEQATQIGRIGDYTEQLAATASGDLEGTDIERELQRQATSDLALGRSLSAEQQRQATQQARAGMAARGLGVGTGALAAEVLNRDAYATAREAERRNFAGNTNQMLAGNRQARIGQVGNILGQSANTRMNQANLRTSLAGANIAIDPYMRALNPGIGMGASTLGQSGQMIGNTYNSNLMMSGNLAQNATQMAGNVAGINASMLDTRWNTVQNNNASLQSAYMGAQASQNAANMGLQGAAMGASAVVGAAAAACWVARAAFGTATARWKDYRRAMLRHASDRTIRLYCQHGEALAATLTTPLRRLAARLTLRTLQWSWN